MHQQLGVERRVRSLLSGGVRVKSKVHGVLEYTENGV